MWQIAEGGRYMSIVWNGVERAWEVRRGTRYLGNRDDWADAAQLEQAAAEDEADVCPERMNATAMEDR
jgi:hypothetical protein